MADALVVVERDAQVGVVLLNRPKALNALSAELMEAIVGALEELDADAEIRAIVLGGSERAFAAGADIGELAASTPVSLYESRRLERWDEIRAVRTPIVAAVSGFCLGGGCELAMLCDLIVASETAKFGQPEINLGVLPGAGGTQRLTRAVGKAVAMDMILTGRMISAREALDFGLVARVVPKELWLEEAKRVAAEIAARGPIAVRLRRRPSTTVEALVASNLSGARSTSREHPEDAARGSMRSSRSAGRTPGEAAAPGPRRPRRSPLRLRRVDAPHAAESPPRRRRPRRQCRQFSQARGRSRTSSSATASRGSR